MFHFFRLRQFSSTPQSRIFSAAVFMFFFWALFDGLLTYLLPIKITAAGFSKTQMGIIVASSSVFGAIFDFALARYLRRTNYRRLFLVVIALSGAYVFFLWSARTLFLYFAAMAIWGLYCDFSNFATFDFVSRRARHQEHSQSFGLIGIFKSLGYLLAPIIAGFIVFEATDFFPFSLAFSFLILSLIFCLILIDLSPAKDSVDYDHTPKYARLNFFTEFTLLRRIAVILLPVLIFNIALYLFDSVFWTIGPLYAESFRNFKDFGGFFMTAYSLPPLLVNWFVRPVSHRFGQKKTAYVSFLFGNLLLLPIVGTREPWLVILFVFLSSSVSSLAWPSIRGACADYISESHRYAKEIEGLNDFTYNLGYILGPAISGLLSDLIGFNYLFLFLASVNVVLVLFLLKITPKSINVALPEANP